VDTILPTANTVTFNERSQFAFGGYEYASDERFYWENVPALPLSAGSWRCGGGCTPAHAGGNIAVVISYKPLPQNQHRRPSMVIPVVPTVFAIQAPNVTLKNFVLSHTAESCDKFDGFAACDADLAAMAKGAIAVNALSGGATLANLTATRIGGYVVSGRGASNVLVTKLLATDIGAGGVNLNQCPNVVVNNSYVTGYGYRFPAGEGTL
jgi:hypothetical protein